MSQISQAVLQTVSSHPPPPSFGDPSLSGIKPEMAQRKITLLTRQQPVSTGQHHPPPIPTNPLASTVQAHQGVTLSQQPAYSPATNMVQSAYQPTPPHLAQTGGGYASLPQAQSSFATVSQLSPSQQGYPSGPQAGFNGPQVAQLHVSATRATRDDYYDTEDPSVNLHEFIINSMQAQKNRIILMKLEEEFIKYVADQSRREPLKCPPWDSYHRMLAHRVAAYFGLEHNVDPVERNCVVVCKGPNTRLPKHRFGDFLPQSLEPEMSEPKLILKRSRENSTVEKPQFDVSLPTMTSNDVKTFEEREVEYEKARARIFSQQPISQIEADQLPFDLGAVPASRNASYWMHHRRTVSDTATAFLSRVTESKKEGSLSNHSSRSATPLISSRPLFLSKESPQASAPHSPQVSPGKLAPQKSQSSPLEPSSTFSHVQQIQQQQQQQRSSSAAIKQPRTRPSFGPLYPASSYAQPMPIIYPQADPMMATWYYNNMMVYSTVPSPSYLPYTQMVQQPVFPVGPVGGQYPVVGTPGVQAANISPIVGQPALRLPFSVSPDQLGSPSHPSGVTLVRPVPQQASPIGLTGKPEGFQWGTSLQSYPFQQTPLALTPTSPQPPPTAFTTYIPVAPNSRLTPDQQMHLEQQMEALSISSEGGDQSGVEGSGVYQAIQNQRIEDQSGGGGGHEPGVIVPQGMGVAGFNGEGGEALWPSRNGVYQANPYTFISNAPGQMMSPTQVGGAPIHFLSSGHILTPQDGQVIHSGQVLQFAVPNQGQRPPTTPTLNPLALQPSMLPGQPHNHLFSPHNHNLAQSPVQILGHTLGTSLFSPPPSSGTPHGIFINSPTNAGKVLGAGPPGSPARAPVGSGVRLRRYESPKHNPANVGSEVSLSMASVPPGVTPVDNISPQQKPVSKLSTSGSSPVPVGSPGFQSPQLPPRLVQQQQQQQQRSSGTRYQNQRHPANRSMPTAKTAVGETNPPAQFSAGVLGSKKEPLLPTPPPNLKVKLDTNLTCGVPLNVMELLSLPPDGSPDLKQAMQRLTELGLVDLKSTPRSGKRGDSITIAIFDTPENAAKALHQQSAMFSLSIPQSNHAKSILSLIGMGTP